MKKYSIIILIALTILVIIGIGARAYEFVPNGVGLNATLLYYQPTPVQPGNTVDVYVQIENNGGSDAKDVTVEFVDNYPFTITSTSDKEKYIDFIPSKSKYVAKFIAYTDKNAAEGTAYVKVRFRQGDGGWQEAYLPINVLTNDVFISVENIIVKPQYIIPGGSAEISMNIKNLADSFVKDLVVKLDLSSTGFSPIGGTNTKKIEKLKGGDTVKYSFKVISSPSTTPDVYQIPLDINFSDEVGNSKSQEDIIGIIVGVKPDMSVFIDSTEVFKDEKKGKITIKFVNKGLSEIKFLTAEVLDSDDYEILSPSNKKYVGNIDTDDYETAEFVINAKKDELNIPLKIEYRDALNRPYEEEKDLKLRLVNSKDFDGKNSSAGFFIIIILLILIAGFYFWRKKKKGGKKR